MKLSSPMVAKVLPGVSLLPEARSIVRTGSL